MGTISRSDVLGVKVGEGEDCRAVKRMLGLVSLVGVDTAGEEGLSAPGSLSWAISS